MDEVKLLYRGHADSVDAIADALEAAGVPCALDDHREIGARSRGRVTPRRNLFVESRDYRRAVSVRDSWLAASRARASGLSRRLISVIVLSTVPIALWLVGWLSPVDGVPEPTVEGVIITWFVSLVVLAQIESRRRVSERIEMPGES